MRNVHRCSSAGNPSVVGYLGLVYHISGAAYRIRGCNRSGYCVSGRYAHRNSPHVYSDGIGDRDSFCDAACRQNPLSPVDARFSSGRMEPSARDHSGYRPGHAGAGSHMDGCYEPEQSPLWRAAQALFNSISMLRQTFQPAACFRSTTKRRYSPSTATSSSCVPCCTISP